MNRVTISKTELDKFNCEKSFAGYATALLKQQKQSWDLLSGNYDQLKNVEVRYLEFDGFKIKIQFNPGRITSSSAKVDKKSIQERKCFLCLENLPEQQFGLEFEDYMLLCNPFPIFPEHFTIPKISHTPQRIGNNFESMLTLTKELGKNYSLFYNGPKCGASAPDHMHFQAGTKHFMTIENDFDNFISENSTTLFSDSEISVSTTNSYLRNIIIIETANIEKAKNTFAKFHEAFENLFEYSDEPMMNVITAYENNKWRVFIVPREKHRPDYFFAEGDSKILLSPASVDLGGVCITPLEKDFEKLTKDQIVDIYKQVCLSGDKFKMLCEKLADLLV